MSRFETPRVAEQILSFKENQVSIIVFTKICHCFLPINLILIKFSYLLLPVLINIIQVPARKPDGFGASTKLKNVKLVCLTLCFHPGLVFPCHLLVDVLENVRASAAHNPTGLHGLLEG
jgi:hypothetical protein